VLSMSVCVSICLSVCSHKSKTMQPNFTKTFVRALSMSAMAWSSSGGVVIRCVLPVLRMTLCFHTVRPVLDGHGIMWFAVWILGWGEEAKSAIYDNLVYFYYTKTTIIKIEV